MAQSRGTSMERLRTISDDDLQRTAELEGVGEVTLRRLLELWMEHDAGHIADMEAIRRGAIVRTTASTA